MRPRRLDLEPRPNRVKSCSNCFESALKPSVISVDQWLVFPFVFLRVPLWLRGYPLIPIQDWRGFQRPHPKSSQIGVDFRLIPQIGVGLSENRVAPPPPAVALGFPLRSFAVLCG